MLSNTQGGPVHDAKQRIIDVNGDAIPRLYAAGEMGSSFGHLYLAGGNIAECFVTGRIAGKEVAGLGCELSTTSNYLISPPHCQPLNCPVDFDHTLTYGMRGGGLRSPKNCSGRVTMANDPKSFDGKGYPDFQDHLKALDDADLLRTIDKPVNKDTEMHPLVRWQFRGGIPETDRKAFVFNNISCSRGQSYGLPVAVGALSANRAIYSIGIGAPRSRISARSGATPSPTRLRRARVTDAPCHEVVIDSDLEGEGKGLDSLPIPISTPGFDSAPYFTATGCISRNPETGVQNMGTYRAGLKSSTRMAVRMSVRSGGAEGHQHWLEYKEARREDADGDHPRWSAQRLLLRAAEICS